MVVLIFIDDFIAFVRFASWLEIAHETHQKTRTLKAFGQIGNLVRLVGNFIPIPGFSFTDSGPFVAQVSPLRLVRSPFGFGRPAL